MLIAISQKNSVDKHGERIDNLENCYVNYLEKFGIKLLVIPNTSKNVDFYFKEFPIDAIIITGGNDIDPESYGEGRTEGLEIVPERDKTEKKLLETAIEKKLPVLGICRGFQFINVFFGGKIITDIKKELGDKVHKKPPIYHKVKITNEKATNLLGKEIEVNSYHNHGITSKTLSAELKAFAEAEDGLIEGIYHPLLSIAGIQWHPERKSPDNEVNEKIIKAFLNKELFWK